MPQFPKVRKEKKGIITSLISSFIGLAYHGISSFLHNRGHKALHKGIKAMETKVDLQYNRPVHLEDSLVMYGVFNADPLERLIKTVHQMHNTTTPNERSFTGELSTAFTWYVRKIELIHFAINLPFFI